MYSVSPCVHPMFAPFHSEDQSTVHLRICIPKSVETYSAGVCSVFCLNIFRCFWMLGTLRRLLSPPFATVHHLQRVQCLSHLGDRGKTPFSSMVIATMNQNGSKSSQGAVHIHGDIMPYITVGVEIPAQTFS